GKKPRSDAKLASVYGEVNSRRDCLTGALIANNLASPDIVANLPAMRGFCSEPEGAALLDRLDLH
ncbi:MAG: hypothetical protein ACR2RA_26140, partial [Geminicoccaceae bacterium]